MGCRRLQRYVARCLSLVQIANEESCRHRRRTLGNGLSTRHLRKRTRRVTFRELLTKGTLGSARHATFNLRLTRSCSFHTTLFPANGTQVPFLTYRRIYEALGAIGRQLHKESGGKKVNLWISRHSLGAGLACVRFLSTCPLLD